MIKKFCDCCGDELVERNTVEKAGRDWRIEGANAKGNLHFKIMTGMPHKDEKRPSWNMGDFCKYCIIDAVKNMDDRPQPARRGL